MRPRVGAARVVGQVALVLALVTLGRGEVGALSVAPLVSIEGTTLVADEPAYRDLARDLAVALRPDFAGPARTVGARGFSAAYHVGVIDIDDKARHWVLATEDAPSALTVSRLSVRKGLPMSVEIGTSLAYLHDEDLWGATLEVRWAFVEGLAEAPDVATRIHIGGLFANTDFAMISGGADVVVGKRFPLAGAVALSPFAGYALSYGHIASRPVAVVPSGNISSVSAVIPSQDVFDHRALVGLDVATVATHVGFELGFGEMTTATFRIGFSL